MEILSDPVTLLTSNDSVTVTYCIRHAVLWNYDFILFAVCSSKSNVFCDDITKQILIKAKKHI